MEKLNKLDDQDLENVAGGRITEEEALASALDHVKLREDQIGYAKIELDYEHNREIYEIEFKKGYIEYEFDIDAHDGRVLKFKKDRD